MHQVMVFCNQIIKINKKNNHDCEKSVNFNYLTHLFVCYFSGSCPSKHEK